MTSYSAPLILCFPFLFFSFFFTCHPSIFVHGDEALIQTLCNATYLPSSCKSCLEQNPGSLKADKIGLIRIAMGCADDHLDSLNTATDNYNRFQAKDPNLKSVLHECVTEFTDVKRTTFVAVQKLLAKDFAGAKNHIQNVLLPRIDGCVQTLVDKKLPIPPPVFSGSLTVESDWKIVLQLIDIVKGG